MAKQDAFTRISGRLDVPNIMREQSRERFAAMPKAQRIPDKRRKPSRYGWRREEQ